MCDEWLGNLNNGKLNGVIFLDVRKAFDSINHDLHTITYIHTNIHTFFIGSSPQRGYRSHVAHQEFVPVATLETVYKGLVQPYFEFGPPRTLLHIIER